MLAEDRRADAPDDGHGAVDGRIAQFVADDVDLVVGALLVVEDPRGAVLALADRAAFGARARTDRSLAGVDVDPAARRADLHTQLPAADDGHDPLPVRAALLDDLDLAAALDREDGHRRLQLAVALTDDARRQAGLLVGLAAPILAGDLADGRPDRADDVRGDRRRRGDHQADDHDEQRHDAEPLDVGLPCLSPAEDPLAHRDRTMAAVARPHHEAGGSSFAWADPRRRGPSGSGALSPPGATRCGRGDPAGCRDCRAGSGAPWRGRAWSRRGRRSPSARS